MLITLAIIGLAIMYISFKAFIFFVALILFLFNKKKDSSPDKVINKSLINKSNNRINFNDNFFADKQLTQDDYIKDYLSRNKAFFYICSPANGIVKRIVAQEGDYLAPGDTLLYITNQNGEEDNITVTVECFVYDIMVREDDVIREGQKLAGANNYLPDSNA